MMHKAYASGTAFIAGCDYVGESIASFLGITSPKYNYEIEQFKKMQEQQATRKAKEDIESANWMEIKELDSTNAVNSDCVTNQDQIKKF